MKFRIAHDSTFREAAQDTRGWYGRIAPWIWLVWLVWMFGPLFFFDGGDATRFPHWLWPTLASLPPFLAMYFACHLGARRHLVFYALGMLALGMLVTPWNPFAQTYLIYACAAGAAWSRPRRSGALVLVLLLSYTAEWLLLGYPWVSAINIWILCPIIAGLIISENVQRQHRAELRLSMDEVRRLAASAERERIGRDLHDLLGHTLSMVTLKSELAGRLIERDPVAARREIGDVERVARDALSQVRSAVSGIRAAALAAELASARLLLEAAGVQMEYWCGPLDLPPNVETCLALVLREAVTNIQRHARANRVEVTVLAGADKVVLRIRDDGRGGVNERGNGLTGMRERIVAQGGDFNIESPHGRGTSIEVSLPVPATLPREAGDGGKVVPIVAATRALPAGGRA